MNEVNLEEIYTNWYSSTVPGVIEEPRIPHGMNSSGSSMEIARIWTIKFIEAIHHILRGMRVDNIQEDKQAHWMGGVNQFF